MMATTSDQVYSATAIVKGLDVVDCEISTDTGKIPSAGNQTSQHERGGLLIFVSDWPRISTAHIHTSTLGTAVTAHQPPRLIPVGILGCDCLIVQSCVTTPTRSLIRADSVQTCRTTALTITIRQRPDSGRD